MEERERDVHLGDGLAAIIVGDTVISLWREPASVPRWDWQVSLQRDAARRFPQGIIAVSIILESSSPPDAKLRARMQADFKRMGPALRKLIAVPLGTSVWAALVRTLVRGILLLSGEAHRQEVAENLEDGVRRIRALATPVTPSPAELRAAFRELFAALDVVSLLPRDARTT